MAIVTATEKDEKGTKLYRREDLVFYYCPNLKKSPFSLTKYPG